MKEMKERLVEFFLRVFGFFLLFGTLFLMCFSLYHLNDKESIRSSSSGVALIPPTAEEQVERLRVQNRLERWDIREEVFDSLISDAVTCPSNLSLSMRIRFGEGDNGVALTFDRHIAVIKRVFQVQNFFDGEITSPVLVRGNDSHKPTIEWICVNMSAFFSEKRGTIEEILQKNSSSAFLADEGLVLIWVFPEIVKKISSQNPPFFLGGYRAQLTIAGSQRETVPCIFWDNTWGRMGIGFDFLESRKPPSFSIPIIIPI